MYRAALRCAVENFVPTPALGDGDRGNRSSSVGRIATFGAPMLGELSSPESRFRVRSWPTLVFALLLTQVILSLTLKQGARLVGFCETTYLVLLLVASAVAALNAVRSRQAIRLFWSLLAVAFALWAVVPCVSLYYAMLPGRIPPFIFD